MKKPAHRNKMANVVVLVAAMPLAACGRVELSYADAATPVIQAVAEEDGAATSQALMAERRHFAIYTAYRALSDESSSMYRSSGDGSAVSREVDAGVPACIVNSLPD
ncbi:hypothetical protein [Noviherbaspirillum denitrificans]|uniref:Lipoprotein n=1 Tax=Noviherbaspirillum denitrificans TaxID=1968433 RepID=A0A254TED2_9BURK|nr:hypothetical protein [Noviherbaspirillum denitrificans]OWW18903.1 hypothetical protein AYR66_04800 [Noviherbaspirillum denitrificans]